MFCFSYSWVGVFYQIWKFLAVSFSNIASPLFSLFSASGILTGCFLDLIPSSLLLTSSHISHLLDSLCLILGSFLRSISCSLIPYPTVFNLLFSLSIEFFFLINLFYLFIYFSVLGLHCCLRAFSSWSKWGLLFFFFFGCVESSLLRAAFL